MIKIYYNELASVRILNSKIINFLISKNNKYTQQSL